MKLRNYLYVMTTYTVFRTRPKSPLPTVAAAAKDARKLYGDQRLREALATMFDAFAATVCSTLDDLHAVDAATVTHLVHYTTLDVLFSILQSPDTPDNTPPGIRLYDTVHVNDPEDGMVVTRHWPANSVWGWNIDRSDDPLSNEGLRISAASPGYTLSFVQSSLPKPMYDHLPFWKEYGSRCRGCSLAIPLEKLSNGQASLVPYRVKYELDVDIPHLYQHLCGTLLEPAMDFANDPKFKPEFQKAILGMLIDAMQPFRFLYKDGTYAHEKECRVVVSQPTNPETPQVDVVYEAQPTADGGTKLRHYAQKHILPAAALFHSDTIITLGPLVPQSYNVTVVLEDLLSDFCRRVLDPANKEESPHYPPTVEHSQIHYREL